MSIQEQFNEQVEPSFTARQSAIPNIPVYVREQPAGAVADITTADATDLASAIALANEAKAKFNALLVTLRSSGELAP